MLLGTTYFGCSTQQIVTEADTEPFSVNIENPIRPIASTSCPPLRRESADKLGELLRTRERNRIIITRSDSSYASVAS